MTDAALLLRALQFASVKHRDQRRKDMNASPYINHPIAVAAALADEGRVTDDSLLVAAALHDTVEDTETTFDELEGQFGAEIADLVRELTDDKTLEKQRRKELQIERARSASPRAKQLKIADKICNIRDIADRPPSNWPVQRRREYLEWAKQVVDGCRGVNQDLDAAFDAALERASHLIEG
ncbi:MAG: bifunctional (p)ppGpp synthetase/guanosine-3',5'-bis(diphosphate) 3'-pyrophosphohydrolase [Acidobacteria bacterium]|nr:MAG: bifunctional (p)ppGpp synthetase/guanosine-3',5'-bis(diphosphate) 3'-pyrophosphohydrolase [Acidobacteriota bacterium]